MEVYTGILYTNRRSTASTHINGMSYTIHGIPTLRCIQEWVSNRNINMHIVHQSCRGSMQYIQHIIVVYWQLIREWATRKAGWDLQENKYFEVFRNRYTKFRVERTHSRIRNLGWTSFPVSYLVPCTLSSSISWRIREECVRLTRTPRVRCVGFTHPMGCVWGAQISLSSVQTEQRARTNGIARAPEFPAKRPVCTMQYVFARYTVAWPLAYQTAHPKK